MTETETDDQLTAGNQQEQLFVVRTDDRGESEELHGPPGVEVVPADETTGMRQHKRLIQEELEEHGLGRARVRALSEFWIMVHTNTLTERELESFYEFVNDREPWQKIVADPIGEVWGVHI